MMMKPAKYRYAHILLPAAYSLINVTVIPLETMLHVPDLALRPPQKVQQNGTCLSNGCKEGIVFLSSVISHFSMPLPSCQRFFVFPGAHPSLVSESTDS
jgi:hypothetical protein